MITVTDLGLQYGGQPLFSHVDLQFTRQLLRASSAPTGLASPPF